MSQPNARTQGSKTKETFEAFFAVLWPEITKRPATFPWQRELARRVVEEGRWPSTLDLPTSAGKTAVLDIAVWALAHGTLQAGKCAFPRRVFFVVDRRIVVDEAAARARLIRDRLRETQEGILRDMADRLRKIGGTAEPLEVSVMRGGMPRETAWVSSPAQPAIILTTVDQLGSRLLFRGYGVTPEMAPIHAGLTATDSLVLLDEAHLSAPFRETLEAVQLFSGENWRGREVARPLEVVSMSATLGQPADFVFRETYERADEPSADLRRRFRAHKRAHLETPVETEKEPSDKAAKRKWQRDEPTRRAALAEKVASLALKCFADSRVRVVGAVVNRVATAREIVSQLTAARDQGKHTVELLLLTGRCRPLDRDLLLERYWPCVRAGRSRAESDAPLIVVATQCIEAGANIDFDALVTEIASLDALRQRFGRLDRFGELTETTARIVARTDQVDRNASADPVYGDALKATWKFLRESLPKGHKEKIDADLLTIDFGIEWLKLPSGEMLERCLAPRKQAPVLLPAHLDLLCQTSPQPHPDPDPAIFLHGPASGPADVNLVWRADLDPTEPSDWKEIVSLLPPSSAEAMTMPLAAAKAWLRAPDSPGDFADVEGAAAEVSQGAGKRNALLWLGPDSAKSRGRADIGAGDSEKDGEIGTRVVGPEEIYPGCTIVVPASYGGADEFGWNPLVSSDCAVGIVDHGDVASARQRGRPVLRLHADVFQSWLARGDVPAKFSAEDLLKRLRALEATEFDEEDAEAGCMEQALSLLRRVSAEAALPANRRELAAELLAAPSAMKTMLYPRRTGIIVIGQRRAGASMVTLDEGNDSSFGTLRPITLEDHTNHVLATLTTFATHCPLATEGLRNDLRLAARLHDLGKCDRRFQTLLHRGDRVAAAAGPLLAKSAARPTSAGGPRRARVRAGVPAGWRHELLTLSLLENRIDDVPDPVGEAQDRDLVLHLIATHHGYCRAIAPFVDDLDVPSASIAWNRSRLRANGWNNWTRLDSGITDRFWMLVRKYGWFGLAYLEAMLRLADHCASSAEEHKPG